MFDIGPGNLDTGYRCFCRAVQHDAFIVQFDTKLAVHFLGELDIDLLAIIDCAHLVGANSWPAHAEDIDICRQRQAQVAEQGFHTFLPSSSTGTSVSVREPEARV